MSYLSTNSKYCWLQNINKIEEYTQFKTSLSKAISSCVDEHLRDGIVSMFVFDQPNYFKMLERSLKEKTNEYEFKS